MFGRLLGRSGSTDVTAPAPEAPIWPDHPVPDRPIYAIGDIHGRVDLLEELLDRIDDDTDRRQPGPKTALVFLGDYVDRGADSAGVLRLIHDLVRQLPGHMACLMGNHERMMLDFIADPMTCGRHWLMNGGAATLDSFGITGVTEQARDSDLIGAAAELRQSLNAIDRGYETWLRGLPLFWISGDVAFVHAAADPARPITAQDDDTMLWGHEAFFDTPRDDGYWCVHGHTIVDAPEVSQRRVNVDTGAVHSGTLTAAALVPHQPVRFLGTAARQALAQTRAHG